MFQDSSTDSGSGVAAIVLAGGASRRLGHPKQLLKLDGTSLIRRAARSALESRAERVFVVIGAQAEETRPELVGLDVVPVHSHAWEKGIGSSIAAGIAAVAAREYEAALIVLVDQLGVSSRLLDRLIAEFERGSRLVACTYAGTLGVPALFSKEFFDDLGNLVVGGAKPILEEHRDTVAIVPFSEGDIDVDTVQDLESTRGLKL